MAKLFSDTVNAITLDGAEITRAEDGSFEIPEGHVAHAVEVFGLYSKPEEHVPPPDLLQELMDAQKNKASLAALGKEVYGLDLPETMKREEMETAIREAHAAQHPKE